jgi:uncharacterized membrane protein YecN with MAPEG domain
MAFPAVTAFYAALLALLYVGLACWVIGARLTGGVLHGDGGDKSIMKRIRSHANFAEHVPFALLLVALLEAQGATSSTLVHVLLIVLLVARVLHPIGMFAPPNSPRQFACRGGGIIATLTVIAVTAILLLLRGG